MGEHIEFAHHWGWSEHDELMLAPELPALIRPTGELQFGANPHTAKIVRLQSCQSEVPTRAVLEALTNNEALLPALTSRGVPEADAIDLIDELAAAGVLVRRPTSATQKFLVLGAGSFAVQVASRLEAAGHRVRTRTIQRRTAEWLETQTAAAVGTAIIAGQLWPDGHLQQALHRQNIPHLPVGFYDGRAALGPLVLPGKTACLSCMDAHTSSFDPQWPMLRLQLAGHPAPAAGPAADIAIALLLAQLGHSGGLALRNLQVRCDPVSMDMQRAPIAPHRLCPLCGQ